MANFKTFSKQLSNSFVLDLHALVYNVQYSTLLQGKERRVQSPALTLEVTGRPQVLLTNASRIQEFVTGTDGVVKAVFCSDPKYRKIFWEWGGLNLTEGKLQASGHNSVNLFFAVTDATVRLSTVNNPI